LFALVQGLPSASAHLKVQFELFGMQRNGAAEVPLFNKLKEDEQDEEDEEDEEQRLLI
jgi:hypothetical protein